MKTVKVKSEKITYSAKGNVYGNLWSGGEGAYTSKHVTANSMDELKAKINEMVNDGSLDGGMGFQRLKGAYMGIKTTTTLVIDEKEFVNEEIVGEIFGDLTEEEINFLFAEI